MLNTATTLSQRTWNTQDLFRIIGTWQTNAGMSGFPRSMRMWVPWFLAIIKMGGIQIKAPIWAISKSFAQSSNGPCSASTTRRALSWMKNNGFINKRNLRLGADCRGVVIDINIERFSFWLQKQKSKSPSSVVIKRTDMCDKNLQQSKRQGDKKMNNTNSLEKDSSYIVSKGINEYDKCKKNANLKKEHKYPPVLHSIWVIVKDRSDWKTIIERAKRRYVANAQNDSINWNYHTQRWLTLDHSMREHIARTDILPKILDESIPTTRYAPTTEQKNQVSELIRAFERKWSSTETVIPRIETKYEQPKLEKKPTKTTISDDEMAILLMARKKISNRMNTG